MPAHDFAIGDQAFVVSQLMQLYGRHPHLALKEYPSNSLDAGATHIGILVNRKERSVIIQDDGEGMSREKLELVPVSIGQSSRRGGKFIGEKALGLLAFGALGDRCSVFTVDPQNSGYYNHLWMQKEPAKWEVNRIDKGRLPYGAFPKGTQVVINGIDDALTERYLLPSGLRAMFSEMYSPRLRKGSLRMVVGYHGVRDSMEEVSPLTHGGWVEVDEVVHTEHGDIELLIFVNPEGTVDKVRTYNDGVLVLPSMTELAEFAAPWNSGRLSGEINEDFNTLVPSRDGYERSKRLTVFVTEIKGYEPQLEKAVREKTTEERKSYLDDFAQSFLHAISAAYGRISKKYLTTRGKTVGTAEDPIERVIPLTDIVTTHVPGQEGSGSGASTHKRSGVEPSGNGEEKHVRGAKRQVAEFYNVSFEYFGADAAARRSLADETFGLIRINIGHPDYGRESTTKERPREFRYVGHLIAKELATLEYSRLCRQRRLDPLADLGLLGEMQADLFYAGSRAVGLA